MNTPEPALGPLLYGTIVAPCADTVARAYVDCFGFRVAAGYAIDAAHAQAWGLPGMQGKRVLELHSASGAASWLRVIEVPGCAAPLPLRQHGWMALEVSVQDVDRLAVTLGAPGSPFRIIGAPALLDISDKIKAMQVIGPAGEVLYLTEVRAAVPPFELPLAPADPVDRLFIAVLSVPQREAATVVYEQLAGGSAYRLDTKITVLNGAFGRAAEGRYPIAVLQLAGSALIEIDEVADAGARPDNPCGLPSGIAMISFALDRQARGAGHPGRLRRGAAGEWIELIGEAAR